MQQPSEPVDMEALLTDAVREALRHENSGQFMQWIQSTLGDYMPPEFQGPENAEMRRAMAVHLGQALWNAMPLPGNHLRPQPLPRPGRNDPCPCGSGRKFKKCCANAPSLPEGMFDPEMMAGLVAEELPMQRLEALAAEGRANLSMLLAGAQRLQEDGRPKKAAALLEPIFDPDAGHVPTNQQTGMALSFLCDVYDELGFGRKKERLLEALTGRLASSPLRAAAWGRLASIHADRGQLDDAATALQKAQRDDPDDPGLGVLEVIIWANAGDVDRARDRARFWHHWLLRKGYPDDEHPLPFLARAQDNPSAAMTSTVGDSDPAIQRLHAVVEAVKGRPVPAYTLQSAGSNHALEGGGSGASSRDELRASLRGMGVPADQIEELADSLMSSLDEAAEDGEPIHAPDGDAATLTPPREVAAVTTDWLQEIDPAKPFSVHDAPLDNSRDPWAPDEAEQWLGFLESRPQAMDSLDIIDDVLTMLRQHPMGDATSLQQTLAEPLMNRAERIVSAAVGDDPDVRLPWPDVGNRSALRSLVRRWQYLLEQERIAEAHHQARQLLQLNPHDNHGIRASLAVDYLHDGRDDALIELAERYPDDMFPELLFGRSLAEFRRGRQSEADDALVKAIERHPLAADYLARKRVRRPADADGDYVTMGGEDQAWNHREAVRPVWERTPGALEWLKAALRG